MFRQVRILVSSWDTTGYPPDEEQKPKPRPFPQAITTAGFGASTREGWTRLWYVALSSDWSVASSPCTALANGRRLVSDLALEAHKDPATHQRDSHEVEMILSSWCAHGVSVATIRKRCGSQRTNEHVEQRRGEREATI